MSSDDDDSDDDDDEIKVDSILTFASTTIDPPGNIIFSENRIRHRTQPSTWTGEGLKGPTISEQVILNELPPGVGIRFWFLNVGVCTGCVDGHTGTLVWSSEGDGQVVAAGVEYKGTWTVLKGMGDLEGATGGGEFSNFNGGQAHFKGKIQLANGEDSD